MKEGNTQSAINDMKNIDIAAGMDSVLNPKALFGILETRKRTAQHLLGPCTEEQHKDLMAQYKYCNDIIKKHFGL